MTQTLDVLPEPFVDQRTHNPSGPRPGVERRQFVDGREQLSPGAKELADAIDNYKLRHRRRYITHEELLSVVRSLGYQK